MSRENVSRENELGMGNKRASKRGIKKPLDGYKSEPHSLKGVRNGVSELRTGQQNLRREFVTVGR